MSVFSEELPHKKLPARLNVWHRKKARRTALQALYQYFLTQEFLTQEALHAIEAQFRADVHAKRMDPDYFHMLLHDVIAKQAELDQLLAPHITRDVDMLDQIEQIILYIAALEFLYQETPPKVIINEAVDLAKAFAAEDSYKYINAVLNKMIFG